MAERYWITGVQLGMFKSPISQADKEKVVDEVIDKQFIGNFPTEEDKKRFLRKLGFAFRDE